ncbi:MULTISPECIES: dTDP-4-amino-4,6-dideoxy-D-galactose acyltransferase [unclassified Enterobacter cloacae complex]|uniref:dTDP-4-amino-4,6-dideoxy-D-galactose acyltransferase n=1 Tax=unclassified Enterobacter cloacae complex TaxID=2757714 RepID=UPI001872A237|nr:MULTISPECIES: dTDP-4-amino-4,6-dideoxy-D-galactose acyltransferase [unclassified Enterobacter cloacae complex]MBE4812906.1 dTDP-4-amino-4,6-dideoxy-D-galactose acyltransferase [Enterobacter cloacae complex sp. P44RS]MBE4830309.1 dTDP-4-amino-4,6-dideoxy-D-galactose acyltransferase [Enterobacter cloacae complex sp. P42RS]MBE4839159.1 dTDP-4-amino-4,6-dideoxy-D-galactose acyltransferase [Enterobacter cloacae complex sp. P46RS]MBE4843233.1 dTDP-4-amino-4,6-dideoxy-D-galactose acyltransferase [E
MSALHGVLESLEWESAFFARPSAIVRWRENAPALQEVDFSAWQRVQAKIPADRADLLDALQQHGFQLVEGEVDLSITLTRHDASGAEIATEQDIPVLRQMAARAFAQSRFRTPWYAPDDSGRFYAQWVENAVKGTFDHVCLIFRAANGQIQGFVSLRKLNEREARIGLLAGRGMGEKLMQAALHWAQLQQVKTLRVATQVGNTAALKRYIASGANIDATAYWLYR